ncbi:hypothetical protein OYT13_04310 [Pandoraea sp. XJJ-1]|uniref:hypothetical protein n=1 Tax=Pandoraea sp. XJJ-1 TaxID=3002643 RepID=UPI00227EAD52|nr:hypothetical protein [Pandoraea sp. XJJ-1]WAL83692.1 hypothetical protein OYT13_04310 [Pandoraea sp. XJJ-1]
MMSSAKPTGERLFEAGPIFKMHAAIKRFGDFTALHAVDFSLEKGEVVSIIGP